MLSINIIILVKSIFQIVLISLKNNNSTVGKTSLYVSMWFTNIFYYSGAIYCYVIFVNKPENCFKGKNYFINKRKYIGYNVNFYYCVPCHNESFKVYSLCSALHN